MDKKAIQKNGKNQQNRGVCCCGALAIATEPKNDGQYTIIGRVSTTKAEEAANFAFLVTDVIIPDGMDRVDVVGYLPDAGIYCHEDDVVYGMDESDSRNERMVLKAVGRLGDSDHKYNPVALSQLAAA